jgi:hypothetical protein
MTIVVAGTTAAIGTIVVVGTVAVAGTTGAAGTIAGRGTIVVAGTTGGAIAASGSYPAGRAKPPRWASSIAAPVAT